jgi:hypothetical protein
MFNILFVNMFEIETVGVVSQLVEAYAGGECNNANNAWLAGAD